MNTGRFSAGASRFAHFAGLSRRSRRAAEGDDDQRDDNTTADDEDEGKDACDDDQEEDKPAGKQSRRARRADDDDDGKDASDDDSDDDDGEEKPASKQGRRAGRAEDDDDGKDASEDDDDQDELNGKGAKAQARQREQARIAHILGSPAAANNLALAVSLACETRMSRQQAVKVLKGQGGSQRDDDRRDRDGGNRHARRDRADRNVALGSDASEPSGKQVVKSSWDAAWKKAGVKLG